MKTNSIKSIALCGLLGLSTGAQASFINLTTIDDGWVKSDITGDTVDTTGTTIALFRSGVIRRHSILEFDVSTLNGAAIAGARLDFTINRFVSNTGSNPAKINIFAYDGDGIVNITDHSAPALQVVDSSTPQGGTGGDLLSFTFSDVTAINSAISNGGLLTLRIQTENFASILFASLEDTTLDAANLHIDYNTSPVPVPASAWLLLSGIGLLSQFRRKVSK